MKRDTLEYQLFTWQSWEEEGQSGDLKFNDIMLKVRVGEFSPGAKFDSAIFVSTTSLLILIDKAGQEHIYELIIKTGKKIEPPTFAHATYCQCICCQP